MAPTPEDSGDDSKLELPGLSIFRRRKKTPDVETSDDTLTETAQPRAELGSEADEPDVEVDEAVGQPGAEDRMAAAEPEPEPEPEADPEPQPEETRPVQPVGTMFPDTVDEPDDEPTQVLPTAAPESDLHEGDGYDDSAAADNDAKPAGAAKKPRRRKPLTLPALDGKIAAPLTGAVVGLAGVAFTFVGQSGCKAIRGTSSCGGVGLFLLIAILALMVLLGAALLNAWNLSDPTNSSFLAVGLVAVVAMLFFLPSIDRWYMVIVIPVLSALTYLLSWWVTHRFIESADET